MNPIAALLLVSVLANAGLSWAWMSAHDEAIAARKDRDSARGAATACSDATEALQELADSRKVDADKARLAAKTSAKSRDQKADQIMSTPATTPGDDCRSASDRASAWLAGRVKP